MTFGFVSQYVSGSSEKVDELMSHLSLEQKIGQMVQIDISKFMKEDGTVDYNLYTEYVNKYAIGSVLNSPFSVLNYGNKHGWTADEWREVIINMQTIAMQAPSKVPILYGIDSIHGASYVQDATLFSQQLNIAASFNIEIAYTAGKIAAKDTRAAGIPWLFSPVLGIALQPLWPRFYETFGEDSYLAAQMGYHIVKGIQDDPYDGGIPSRAAACMKHFIAYSDPESGHDRASVQLPDIVLKQIYIPSFQAAIDAGVLSAMESYQEVGGIPMASSFDYLTKLLRVSMGFKGMLVTDYQEIENLHDWHKIADTQKKAVEIAMKDTTIDMSMVPLDTSFNEYLLQLVQEGVISKERVDASARRVLELKDALGLLDTPIPPRADRLVETVGQESDWVASLDAARESITLLQNEQNVLPFPSTQVSVDKKILVTGPNCNSLVRQTGGWSIHWQGAYDDSEFSMGVTILQGLQQMYGADKVTYYPGPSVTATNLDDVNDLDEAIAAAKKASVVVFCIGEDTYTEKPGDINDLNLAKGQVDYVQTLTKEASDTPSILLIVSGRPRLLQGLPDMVDAVLECYLPGPLGGQAVAEIMIGLISPSGRLPFTYPKHHGSLAYTYARKPSTKCVDPVTKAYIDCEVEWEFGSGLSYSTFSYSVPILSSIMINEDTTLTVSTTVTNTGAYTAKDVVLLFLTDVYRRVTPEYKLLKRFTKVELAPGQSSKLKWDLSAEDLKYIGIDGRYILEDGEYMVTIGHQNDCRTSPSSQQCVSFTLQVSPNYNPICDYACTLWSEGINEVTIPYEQCHDMCVDKKWTWNYVDCIEDAISHGQEPNCYNALGETKTDSDNNSGFHLTPLVLGIISGIVGMAIGIIITVMILYGKFSIFGKRNRENFRSLANGDGDELLTSVEYSPFDANIRF